MMQIPLTITAATGKVSFRPAERDHLRFPTQGDLFPVLPVFRDTKSTIYGFRAAEDKQGYT